MKHYFLITLFFSISLLSFSQDFLYVRVGETFYNAKGEPVTPLRYVNITSRPQTVPKGKMWMSVENRYLTVTFDSDINKARTSCGKKMNQKPYVMFNIIQKRPYEKEDKWGVIFSRYNTLNRNKFEFIPDAFVREDFDLNLLKLMVPRMVGEFDIKFYPGTEVSVDKCINQLDLIEVDVNSLDLARYNRIVAGKKAEYDKRILIRQHSERKKVEKLLMEKIKKGHVFAQKELDIKPWYQLNKVNFLELFKKVYYNKFYIDFIINEDGSLKIISDKKIKLNNKMLKKFLVYTPGKIIVNDKKVNVKTKMRIVFSPENFVKRKKATANFFLKKRNKDPMIQIKKYPKNYTDRELKNIIDFRTLLKKQDKGTYEFNIENYKGVINILIDGEVQEEIISQKIEKYRYKYKTKKSKWKFQ